ncbi:MAG: mechanosensitive ion channel family protein [Longimicrobiales bacterium]|nr:mechanosensitive ion channel family protein [Longimicrobiales bacterium]
MSLDTIVFGISLREWLLALAWGAGTVFAVRLVLRIAIGQIRRVAERTQTDLDDLVLELLEKTRFFFYLLVALYAGAQALDLPEGIDATMTAVITAVFFLQLGLWGMGVISYGVARYKRRTRDDDPGMATAIGALGFVAHLALWSVLLLTTLATFEVDITAMVASLGIGGLAVALALQNVFSDLLASLSIIFDKPFVIGDFVVIGDFSGTIESVGLKTTRIRSLSGEQLVFSNSDLLSSRIRNFKRMAERRVVFQIGVEYGLPAEKLRRIPELVRAAVEGEDNARFARCHFKAFGNFSLDYETVYFMSVPDYDAYMDTQQAINFGVYESFEREGIPFAFPTQSIHLVGTAPGDASS